MNIKTVSKTFKNPLYLKSGRILEPYTLTYETYGNLNSNKSNVIVVCHALTGSHHAAGKYTPEERKSGWWDALIGPDKTIDTNKYFVICVNTLGSCFGSTGPMSQEYPSSKQYRLKFPVITISDMVKAQKILFNELEIYSVKAVIGGSMGGMQVLSFATEYPNFAEHYISLAATHATTPWTIAFNKIARESIIKDPKFNNGEYDQEDIKKNGFSGLATARMSGFISYLSPKSMQNKFSRKYVLQDGLYQLFGKYEVERYLDYNGNNFVSWFDPLSYLYITKAINIFDLSLGFDSLQDSLKRVSSSLHLISFKSDCLFFPKEMQEIKSAMDEIGKANLCTYLDVDSEYGHDSFLVETEKFNSYIQNILS
ncbi:MAG: Homoserine O-acetyltransferase (EC [uncultured Campylobacterales bacterium]|uniref:Homoserine O-acetyltransferase n=1 Tax=uncultured Campylobacterales bacterium TaxID=352960 RepID=A0A6S6THK1_9BACT|nr:MAG: Homoserine O-acetyltransferase (EC [uncultured Campylobacterales bacterium]